MRLDFNELAIGQEEGFETFHIAAEKLHAILPCTFIVDGYILLLDENS